MSSNDYKDSYNKITKFMQTYKCQIAGGVLAVLVYFQYPTSVTWLAETWWKKHNPVNAIYPKGMDTSDVNKLPVK